MVNNNSFWLNSFEINHFNKLDKNIECDVCIVGGGLTGITTAYYLSKNGYNVVLIEKHNLMSKTSGHTTAKITSQHGLFYKYLIQSQNKNFASKYLQANEEAIQNIKNIINNEDISCDLEEKNAYVFTSNSNNVQKIKDEVDAVNSLNIIKCNFVNKLNTNLNLDIKGAIEFENQAQFNPIKYTDGLIKNIVLNGGMIFENTSFENFEKNNNYFNISTNTNYNIISKYLVLATRYPIINFPGYYFLKMYQETSYAIAVKPTKKFKIDGMFINDENPKLSIKTAKYNNQDILLFGGYNNKTGENIDLTKKYEELEMQATKICGECETLYKWNTEDTISLDKMPYIGDFSNFTENIFIATGFDKWGMTTSNIAANIIYGKINNSKNDYEEIFKATRLSPIKNNNELKNMISQSIKSLVIDKLKDSKYIIDDIKNDEGKIVMFGDKKVGIYKDKKGNVYAVNPTCAHLGCELTWNNLNKTWDCPCHGSRYEFTGKVIYSPSIKNLENYNFE